ncbi:hypothetical protein Tco_0660982 [Tanacetum coccineum]
MLFTPSADPERQFRSRRELTPSSVNNIFRAYMNLRRQIDYGGVFEPRVLLQGPCFQTHQPYTTYTFVSPNENDEVNIDSMTIEEVLNDLFRIGAENFKRIKQKEVQVKECDEGNTEEIWDIMI